MAWFDNPQVYEFHCSLAGDLAWATHDGNDLVYHLSPPHQYLESLLGDPPPELRSAGPENEDFWRGVLDYEPHDELEFVTHGGRVFPREVFDWRDEAEYEFMNWSRERRRYLLWLEQAKTLRASLPEPKAWPPPEPELVRLEEQLKQEDWPRTEGLQSLHRLGLLEDEDGDLRSQYLQRLGPKTLFWWCPWGVVSRALSATG